MRSDDLRIAESKARIAVSPISVYELLCHLDEKDKRAKAESTNTISELFKANLLKCKNLILLDDPFAEQAEAVGAGELVNPTRFEDKIVLPQLFPKLEESLTLEDFYSSTVQFPNGDIGRVRDAAARARFVLDEQEAQYKAHVTEWCKQILEEFGYEQSQQFEPIAFVRFATHSAAGLAEYYEDGLRTNEANVLDLHAPVFSKIYANIGYGIARAIEYLRRANGCMGQLHIDPNDLEDSAICLHLSLIEHRVLVTGDKGTLDALGAALDNLRLMSETTRDPLLPFTEVISTEEFKNRVLPKTSAPSSIA